MLLEDQDGITSELGAPGNGGITGFNIVDDIKTAVENVCPGVVSCADILAIASRDAVTLVPNYSKLINNIRIPYDINKLTYHFKLINSLRTQAN